MSLISNRASQAGVFSPRRRQRRNVGSSNAATIALARAQVGAASTAGATMMAKKPHRPRRVGGGAGPAADGSTTVPTAPSATAALPFAHGRRTGTRPVSKGRYLTVHKVPSGYVARGTRNDGMPAPTSARPAAVGKLPTSAKWRAKHGKKRLKPSGLAGTLEWQPRKALPVSDSARHHVARAPPFRAPVTGVLTASERLVPMFRHRFRSRPFKFFRQVFTRFDADGSGRISQEEMAAGMREIYPGITDKQAAEFFNAVVSYQPGPAPLKQVPGGKKHRKHCGLTTRVGWWPSYIAAETEATTKRGASVSSKGWPPAPASAASGGGSEAGAKEVSFSQFFEFLLHRKETGDVFDPWTVEYDSDEDFEDKARNLPVFMRSKADRARDIAPAVRNATAQQAVAMLMRKVQEQGAVAIFSGLDVDRSGKISAREFRTALKKLGVGLNNKHIDALMHTMDDNHDGEIDLAEFVQFTQRDEAQQYTRLLAAGGTATPPVGASKTGNDAEKLQAPVATELFASIASGGTGVEVAMPQTERDVVRLFRKLCPANNGFVPTEALKSELHRRFHKSIPGGGMSKKQIDDFVALCDTNADGYAEVTDLKRAFFALGAALAGAGPLSPARRGRRRGGNPLSSQAQAVADLPRYTPLLGSDGRAIEGFSSSDEEEEEEGGGGDGDTSATSSSPATDGLITVADLDNRGGMVAASMLAGGDEMDTATLLATTAVRGGRRAGKVSVPAAPAAAPAFVTKLTTGRVQQPPHLRDRVGELLSPRASVQVRAYEQDVATGRTHIAPTNTQPDAIQRTFQSSAAGAVKERVVRRLVSPRPSSSAADFGHGAEARTYIPRGSALSPRYQPTAHVAKPAASTPLFLGDKDTRRYETTSALMSARVQDNHRAFKADIAAKAAELRGSHRVDAHVSPSAAVLKTRTIFD